MSLRGRIAHRRAVLSRDPNDRLLFRWRGVTFDLERAVVRHRDDEGEITFAIGEPGGRRLGARYRRRGPRLRDVVFDQVDFTADEPWTWEDTDFGLRVFHVATGTGPVKYRHRIEPRRRSNLDLDPAEPRQLTIDDDGVVRERQGGRTERAAFAELREVRAKFEASGIWAEKALLVLHTAGDLALVPLGYTEQVERARSELLPRLRILPGWNEDANTALDRACQYGLRELDLAGEDLHDWAERPIWARP